MMQKISDVDSCVIAPLFKALSVHASVGRSQGLKRQVQHVSGIVLTSCPEIVAFILLALSSVR